MEAKLVVLVGFFLLLLVVDCSSDDSTVNRSATTDLDPKIALTRRETDRSNEKDGSSLLPNSTNVDSVKTIDDHLGGSEARTKVKDGMDKSDLSTKTESTEAGGDEKNKLGGRTESKSVDKEGGNEEDVSSTMVGNKGSRGEECGSSNMCTIKESKLVACLRVPGDESPDLLLLIQNKGKGPLSVTISAPDFVQLEERKVQVQEKEGKKVKVSNVDGGTESLITLTAGNGKCSLDFRDLIAHSSPKEFDNSPKYSFISFLRRPAILFACGIFFPLIVVSALVISLRRRYLSGSGLKYQRPNMELPVSSGGKPEMETRDGWDKSWGDSWDDEEALETPSMPRTPSFLSKGLASRRLSKEGWKV